MPRSPRQHLAALAVGVAATVGLPAGPARSASAGIRPGPTAQVVVTTASLRLALSQRPSLRFTSARPAGIPIVTVHDNRSFQRYEGVGGALTDSSAWLIYDRLAPAARTQLLSDLFGSNGIRLGFIRIPIAASDFTAAERPYSYDDVAAHTRDPALLHFSIAHDLPYILPTLRQALALNPGAFVLATPWTAPAWMKTNGSLENRAGRGRLIRSDYGPFARYFVKFLKAYARAGVTVDAVTPQNEPGNPALYPGMSLDEPGEVAFIRGNLVPALAHAGLATKVYGYDYGWSSKVIGFAQRLVRSPAAGELAGIATHCYFGSPTEISGLHALNPRLDEIVSECSPGIMPYSTTELEIASFRNWASAVALWNLALEPNGEPVQPPDSGCPHCTGIVAIDSGRRTFSMTPAYYQLGQVSRFVEPGAVRIGSNTLVHYSYPGRNKNIASPGLDDVAFRNPDGTEVLVAYDNSTRPITFAMRSHGRYVSYRLAAGETATLSWSVSPAEPAG
jgi:glucosylceramidase